MNPLFYDVPNALTINLRGQMLYTIFDDPVEAMAYAAKLTRGYPPGLVAQVNRRVWHPDTFDASWIDDRRGSNCP